MIRLGALVLTLGFSILGCSGDNTKLTNNGSDGDSKAQASLGSSDTTLWLVVHEKQGKAFNEEIVGNVYYESVGNCFLYKFDKQGSRNAKFVAGFDGEKYWFGVFEDSFSQGSRDDKYFEYLLTWKVRSNTLVEVSPKVRAALGFHSSAESILGEILFLECIKGILGLSHQEMSCSKLVSSESIQRWEDPPSKNADGPPFPNSDRVYLTNGSNDYWLFLRRGPSFSPEYIEILNIPEVYMGGEPPKQYLPIRLIAKLKTESPPKQDYSPNRFTGQETKVIDLDQFSLPPESLNDG